VSGALLDTSILIAAGGEGSGELPPAAAISVITVGELRAGVLLARTPAVAHARRLRLEAVRTAFLPLLVDLQVAERYGDVLLVARRQRRTVEATDLLIIATAAATRRVLHTRDEAQARLASAVAVEAVAA